jgi:hypothetical protein
VGHDTQIRARLALFMSIGGTCPLQGQGRGNKTRAYRNKANLIICLGRFARALNTNSERVVLKSRSRGRGQYHPQVMSQESCSGVYCLLAGGAK